MKTLFILSLLIGLSTAYQFSVANTFRRDTTNQQDIFWQMSVVDDALTAVQVGVRDEGITSMHDATECGVWGGLYEVARASRVGMVIDKGAIIVQDSVARICDLFGIDPYSSISEGSLIITCRPHKADAVIDRLARRGIPSTIVGEVVGKTRKLVVRDGQRRRELEHHGQRAGRGQ
jgi:hydrogenase expression/formation protein HypE